MLSPCNDGLRTDGMDGLVALSARRGRRMLSHEHVLPCRSLMQEQLETRRDGMFVMPKERIT